jgi:hypothetical protein
VKTTKKSTVSTKVRSRKSGVKTTKEKGIKVSKKPSLKRTYTVRNPIQLLQSNTDKKLKYAMTGSKKPKINQPKSLWDRFIEIITGKYES